MTPLGLALAACVLSFGAAALWYRRIQQVRVPRRRAPFVAAWSAGALLGVLALVRGPGWLAGGAALAAVVTGGVLVTLAALARQRVGSDAIRVGMPLPAFTAVDEHDRPFDAAGLAGRPVLIKFFRGHW